MGQRLGSKSSLQKMFIAQKKLYALLPTLDYLLKIKTLYSTPTDTLNTCLTAVVCSLSIISSWSRCSLNCTKCIVQLPQGKRKTCLLLTLLRSINQSISRPSKLGRGADFRFYCGRPWLLRYSCSRLGTQTLTRCLLGHICTHVEFQDLMRSCTILHLVG